MIASKRPSVRARVPRRAVPKRGSAPIVGGAGRRRARVGRPGSARSVPTINTAAPDDSAPLVPPRALPAIGNPLPVVSASGLSRYLRDVHGFPLLDLATEQSLARRWREHGDLAAAHQLVTSHLRLVVKMAAGYRGYGLPLSELISEGNLGLMQAVKRFEPERGFRLATYAMWWIRASIQEYVLHSWSLVKIGTTAAQKKLFFGLRRIKARLKAIEDGDLEPETRRQIARELRVSEAEVVDMNRRLAAQDASLNSTAGGETGTSEWQDHLADEGPGPELTVAAAEESTLRRGLVRDALIALSERDRLILTERRLSDPPRTLEEISQRLGLSRERVRQLENRAFDRVSQWIKKAVSERHLVLS